MTPQLIHPEAYFGALTPEGHVHISLRSHRFYEGTILECGGVRITAAPRQKSPAMAKHVRLGRTPDDLFFGSLHTTAGVFVVELRFEAALSLDIMVTEEKWGGGRVGVVYIWKGEGKGKN